MKTLIRSDSSSTIGLGHIMRDLVFAKTCEGEVLFACQPLEGNIIASIPYEVKILTTPHADELISLIHALHIDLLVIDHYGIDATYEKAIKEATGVKLLSFDDTYVPHHCDILFNHNLYADATRYETLVPKGCELRLAEPLIREEFHEEKKQHRTKHYDMFIAMGGTDASNITLDILKTLPSTKRLCVLTTTANAHLSELKTFVMDKPHISLHVNSTQVAKLMHESELAIVTPSVMVHEVLFLGIPFIAIKVASNQDDMFAYLEKNHYPVLKEWDAASFMRLYNA